MHKTVILFLKEFLAIQTTTLGNIADRIKKINPIDEDRTNSLAYLIHNYYSCTEDAIKEIFKTFDGAPLSKSENYHKDLLLHARIELRGTRPNLLGDQTFRMLEEILRFRHLFRHAYNYVLNPARVKENKVLVLENHIQLMEEFRLFTIFLESILEN